MENILNNPYRIIGIYATDSESDLQKQQSLINASLNAGKEPSFDSDFPFLPIPNRKAENIEKAFSQIQDAQNKLFHGLFWFSIGSHIDKTAMEQLKLGHIKKAKQIWKHNSRTKAHQRMNILSYNNLSTLEIILACNEGFNEKQLIAALKMKFQILNNDLFPNLSVAFMQSARFTDQNEIINLIFDRVLGFFCELCSQGIITAKKSYAALKHLIIAVDGDKCQILKDKLISVPITVIESEINETTVKRINNRKDGVSHCKELIMNTMAYWKLLKHATSENLVYKMIGDKLAQELLNCISDFIKEHLNDNSKSQVEKGRIIFDNDLLGLIGSVKDYSNSINVLQEIENKEKTILDLIMSVESSNEIEPIENEFSSLLQKLNQLEQSIYESSLNKARHKKQKTYKHLYSRQSYLTALSLWDDCKNTLHHINNVLTVHHPYAVRINSVIIEKIMVLLMRQVNAIQSKLLKKRELYHAQLLLLSFFQDSEGFPTSTQLNQRLNKNLSTLKTNLGMSSYDPMLLQKYLTDSSFDSKKPRLNFEPRFPISFASIAAFLLIMAILSNLSYIISP